MLWITKPNAETLEDLPVRKHMDTRRAMRSLKQKR